MFDNLKIYRLTQPLNLDSDTLERQLIEMACRPCGQHELATVGWHPLLGHLYAHVVQGTYTLVLKMEERILPSKVVKRETAERVAMIEAETGSPVGKRQQQDIQQEIITYLLPRAFVDHRYILGTVIPDAKLVIVNTPSDARAEQFLALLRRSIGSLPVVPLARINLQAHLTHWVQHEVPEKFELMESAALKKFDESESQLAAKDMPLDSEEIVMALDNGMFVQRLAICYDDAFTCEIHSDGSIKKIRFSDRVKEENEDIPKSEIAARIDADLCLEVGILTGFIETLAETLSLDAE